MQAIRAFGPKLGPKVSTRSQSSFFLPCKPSCFPVTSSQGKHAHLVPLKAATTTLACEDEESNRKFLKLGPSEWRDYFIFANVDISEMDALGREIEALKPKVREMFISFNGYEIEESLKDGFQKIEEIIAGEDDLYTISIVFYVFRTYSYNISSDVFNRFKGDNGEFKECLAGDAKGILSLYEAANMGMTTDYILDDALSFTLRYLKTLAASGTCKSNLSRLIQNALDLPQHKNMEIVVAKEYIQFYEQEEDHDKTLLKFAKLNFKVLQLHYLQELKVLSEWYKEQQFETKLPPYIRDILVECNFTTITYMEPKYSRVRRMVTKIYSVQLIIDDTCDRYATLSEIESLASTLERWDLDDQDMVGLPAAIEDFKEVVRANLKLAKWVASGELPSFDEYVDTAGVEIAVFFTLTIALMGMDQNICKKEAYEWLNTRYELGRAMSTKARVANDMFGYEDDMSRGYVTNSVNCYMKQYGVTEEEAFRKLGELVAEGDKMMNEEFLKPINVPNEAIKEVLKVVHLDTYVPLVLLTTR